MRSRVGCQSSNVSEEHAATISYKVRQIL